MSSKHIESTALWKDIQDIITSNSNPVKFDYKAMLHTSREDIPIFKLISIDVIRDYYNNISDQINIELMMPMGDYMHRLYPNRNNLEMTIKKIQLKESDNTKEKNSNIRTDRFKVIFLPNDNKVYSSSELSSRDHDTLNAADVINVKLQLVNRSLEAIRIKTVQGIYRQVTQKQIIHSILVGESNKIIIDGKPSIDGIDIIEPDNKDIKKHIILPSGLRIVSMPTYLQEKMGGVYSTGIGTYLQKFNNKNIWYIYPLYNTSRFNDSLNKAIIYSLPQNRYNGLDRTYKSSNNTLKIVVTSENKYIDSADLDYMNRGSGYRLSDARSFMKKPIEISEDGPVGRRTNLNHEVVALDRDDNLNYAPISSNRISSNPFQEYSLISARQMARIDLIWENADIDLIYPGMPCKFIFLHKDLPVELNGIIAFAHSYTTVQGNTVTNNVYKNKCIIVIMVEKYSQVIELLKAEPIGEF